MALTTIIGVIIFLCIKHAQSQLPSVYFCHAGEDCIVNCTHPGEGTFSCNPESTTALIKGDNATKLEVFCYEKDACANLRLECPISTAQDNQIECILHCDYDNSCNTVEIWTHNSQKIDLECGKNLEDGRIPNEIQCDNIIIEGKYDVAETVPSTQDIIINCNDEGLPDITTPVCRNIVTRNLGAFESGNIPNNVVSLRIECGSTAEVPDEECITCDLFSINGGKSKFVEIYVGGDLSNSNFSLNDLGLLEMYVEMVQYGTIVNTTIWAQNVQNKLKFNSTSSLAMNKVAIYGPTYNNRAKFEIESYADTEIINAYFRGRFLTTTGGLRMYDSWLDGSYGADYHNITAMLLQNVELRLQNVINASYLQFNGLASGLINMSNTNSLSNINKYQYQIICSSANPDESCNGLQLIIPEYTLIDNTVKREHVFLECLNYGCTDITTESVNGANDYSVSATNCKCDQGGNSCIGEIAIHCGDNEDKLATFNGVSCSGDDECCGPIEAETSHAICGNNSDSSISGGEVAAIIIGVIIALLLIIFLGCYCNNQKTLKHHISGSNKNPYTQSIKDNDTNNDKPNTTTLSSGGYGAVTDDAI